MRKLFTEKSVQRCNAERTNQITVDKHSAHETYTQLDTAIQQTFHSWPK